MPTRSHIFSIQISVCCIKQTTHTCGKYNNKCAVKYIHPRNAKPSKSPYEHYPFPPSKRFTPIVPSSMTTQSKQGWRSKRRPKLPVCVSISMGFLFSPVLHPLASLFPRISSFEYPSLSINLATRGQTLCALPLEPQSLQTGSDMYHWRVSESDLKKDHQLAPPWRHWISLCACAPLEAVHGHNKLTWGYRTIDHTRKVGCLKHILVTFNRCERLEGGYLGMPPWCQSSVNSESSVQGISANSVNQLTGVAK